MSSSRFAIVALLFCRLIASGQTVPSNVPSQYQSLYSELQGDISTFSQAISAQGNGTPYPTLFASQALTANSDLGSSLLNANYFQYDVLPELQELQALGVSAVSVHINFPVLYEPYYGNQQTFQSYVTFYQQVAQQIHSMGMKMTVETTVATAEPGTNGSTFQAFYQGLTWNEYIAGRAQNALNVAQLIQPDYMSVITEPDSESQNSFQPNAGTPSGSLQELQTILAALQAANVTNVPVGAGAGTWINSFTTYIQNAISASVSYVDTHMYSVSNSFPENALTAASMAHAAGLPIAMSETWCKKVSASQLAGLQNALNSPTVDALDTMSFWEPLDQQYLQSIVNMAQAEQFLFVSPFWSNLFYASLDYGTYGSQDPTIVLPASYSAAINARSLGSFTSLGTAWETMILPSPDTTAPQVPSAPSIGQFSQTVVQILWNPTTDNIGVAGYNLFRNGTLLTTQSQVNYTDSSVSAATTYSYQVQAFDAAGNVSAMSAAAGVTTLSPPDNTPPSVPTGLQGAGLSDLSLSISWKPSTDNVAVAGYYVYRGAAANSLTLFASTPATSYIDSSNGMYPKTTFYYAVAAFDASGNVSAQSAAIGVTTLPDTTPPSAPASLTAVAQGPQQVALNWSASTDDVKVAGYSISRGKTPTSMIVVGNTTSTSFVDTAGLSAAQMYYYTVSAYDAASNYSTPSPMVTVTTLPVGTPPTVILQTSQSPSAIGQTVTFTATVRLTSGTIPNGETVVFQNGSTQIGSGTTNGGIATFSIASLAVGSNSITATYTGDGTYQAATSQAVNQVVIKNTTTTTVTSSANPSSYGQSVTLTALVSSTGATPTGNVTFKNGTTPIGSGTLANGVASFSTTTLATGTNSITVFYGGDALSLTSTSPTLSQVVNDSTVTLALRSNANPAAPNQQVTFTGTLTLPNGGNPTGTITFSQNGVAIGSPVAVSSRQASISTSFSTPGTYGITAVYSGDSNFAGASAPSLSQVITAATTTTSIQSSGSPAAVSTPVTFTASVHPASGTVPNGETVTFADGATTIGTGVTASGIATFTTSSLAVGTHSITASYAGDANFAPSKSAALPQTISKNTTTTTIASSVNPSSYEQSVTFTVTVSSSGVTPTGTVTFKNGTTPIGSSALANGVATFSTTTLATGSNAISASYGGDAFSLSSTSSTLTQVVNGSTISLALKASVNPSMPTQQVTFTGILSVPNGGTPTGTITFSENGVVIGSPVAVSSRQASISTSFSTTGNYAITAVYSGDANFTTATAPALSQVVTAATTITSVKSSGSPATVSTPVTFTATIRPTTGTVPNGEVVTFIDGTTTIGAGATVSGVATFTTSSLAVGSHSITANYAGDANYSSSTSTAISETIIKNTTTTAVTSNLNPSTYDQSVTLTATVSSPGPTPTGTLTFKNGTSPIGQATLVNGVGTLTTATLPVGTNSITVAYGGDGASNGSTSPALSQVVNVAPTTTVIVSSLNPSNPGQSVKFTATVASASGTPTGTVTFTQGATTLGTATLVGGNAGLTTNALSAGADVITATYNGTASFAGSSATFTQTVN